ncbi:MAG: hypothetical protein FWG99_11915 [Treponema sp.]|nr:hypothetical protein [Treponema sp.]
MGWQRQKCRPRAAFLASDRTPVPCFMVHISAAAIAVEKPPISGYRIPAGTALYKKTIKDGITTFERDGNSTEEMAVQRHETVQSFLGFYHRGKLKYMPAFPARLHESKILDWKKNFIKLENVNNNAHNLMREIYNRVKEFLTRENRANRGIEREWDLDRVETERRETKELKRTIICQHPLEWDKDLYLENGAIRPNIRTKFGIPRRQEYTDRFKAHVEAIDIWSGLKGKQIEDLNLTENNFWFAHPEYFLDYLDKEGLLTEPRIRGLINVQNEVIALPCLKPRTGLGIYKQGGVTFCNHAVYITVKAVDNNYKHFTGFGTLYNDDVVPWTPDGLKDDDFKNSLLPSPYNIKNTNIWCDILAKQAESGVLIQLDDEEQAHEYANMGYVVIGAWKNLGGGDNNPPHYATVRPGYELHPDNGLMLANVGENNGIRYVTVGFERIPRDKINWYYNPNQDFQYNSNEVLKYLAYK